MWVNTAPLLADVGVRRADIRNGRFTDMFAGLCEIGMPFGETDRGPAAQNAALR